MLASLLTQPLGKDTEAWLTHATACNLPLVFWSVPNGVSKASLANPCDCLPFWGKRQAAKCVALGCVACVVARRHHKRSKRVRCHLLVQLRQ